MGENMEIELQAKSLIRFKYDLMTSHVCIRCGSDKAGTNISSKTMSDLNGDICSECLPLIDNEMRQYSSLDAWLLMLLERKIPLDEVKTKKCSRCMLDTHPDGYLNFASPCPCCPGCTKIYARIRSVCQRCCLTCTECKTSAPGAYHHASTKLKKFIVFCEGCLSKSSLKPFGTMGCKSPPEVEGKEGSIRLKACGEYTLNLDLSISVDEVTETMRTKLDLLVQGKAREEAITSARIMITQFSILSGKAQNLCKLRYKTTPVSSEAFIIKKLYKGIRMLYSLRDTSVVMI